MRCPNCPRTDAKNMRGMYVNCFDCGVGIWVPPTKYPWTLIIGVVIIIAAIGYALIVGPHPDAVVVIK